MHAQVKIEPVSLPESLIARIALAGAIAYDRICTTSAQLRRPAGASSQALLNLKIDSQFRAYGGCGANIAYNLRHLGHDVDLISISGRKDDADLIASLNKMGANTAPILRIDGQDTAQATIITDPDGDQFTAFFPGPSATPSLWQPWVRRFIHPAACCFVQAPFAPHLSIAGTSRAAQMGLPVIWCPGQYADQMGRDEICSILEFTHILIGNTHEISHLRRHGDLSQQWLIETAGSEPVTLFAPDQWDQHPIKVPVPDAFNPIDPTGCGDALLAGFVHHLVAASADCKAPVLSQLIPAVEAGIQLARACLGESGSQAHSVAAILE